MRNGLNKKKKVISSGVDAISVALARVINRLNYLDYRIGDLESYTHITPSQAFLAVFGGPITAHRVASNNCECWAQNMGNNKINFYNTISPAQVISHPLLIVHEIGHTFDARSGLDANSVIPNNLLRPTNSDGIIGTQGRSNFGYFGPHFDWQFGKDASNRQGEEFADMFVGWVYNRWEGSALGNQRRDFMNALMVTYLP
ncbi:MAG: hypothetical protein ABIU06_16955 [Anaerolineales bacterium]